MKYKFVPHPKAPGIAQVPPRQDGKSASNTLYPVNKGISLNKKLINFRTKKKKKSYPYNFSITGLLYLTGQ
jgi:hypothetical protein